MKNQVLNIEQMKYLQELGVDTSTAKMSWYAIYETLPNWYNELNIRDDVFDKNYPSVPTFTLQNMLEMLPKYILIDGYKYFLYIYPLTNWVVKYDNLNRSTPYKFESADIMNAVYECLCWLAENNYIRRKG